MKKSAVFTIVKNEWYFLQKWVEHYKKYFPDEDIYILDHQTTDGSTDNLDVNVIKVINDATFDANWLRDTVQNFQTKLLEDYECVLFAEVDEIVYSIERPLNEFIDEFIKSNDSYVTCFSHEIMENFAENEEPVNLKNEKIIDKRNWWCKQVIYKNLYDKTLLSKIPLIYDIGFHDVFNGERNYVDDFFMVHLHRFDVNYMLKRGIEKSKWTRLPGAGVFPHTREEIIYTWFPTVPGGQFVLHTPLTKIDERHKQVLSHI